MLDFHSKRQSRRWAAHFRSGPSATQACRLLLSGKLDALRSSGDAHHALAGKRSGAAAAAFRCSPAQL
jgi:hypothetical protein